MHQIQLCDEVFQIARERALELGYESVDEYVEAIIREDELEPTPNLDHLFTPERLTNIDKAQAQIDAGLGLTEEQVEKHLAKVRQTWLEQRQQ